MPRLMNRLCLMAAGCAVALLATTACQRPSSEAGRSLGFDEFVPVYNRHIRTWLLEQQKASTEELARIEQELAATTDDEKARASLEIQLETLRRDMEKWRFRLERGDYLKFATPDDIPAGLVWEDGMDQPEIGDPAATKGGVFRKFMPTFPPTIRPFGDNSNNSFRGDLYDNIDMTMVALHPETMEMIPGLAKEWAVSADGRTIYFRLDPEARYSDGVPVRARDFLVSVYLRVSDHIVNPYSKQFYRENIAGVTMYDDLTVSVSLPESKVFAPAIAGAITPSPPHFYTEYGPDFSERYQWRFPPTTGAYKVLDEDIVKGASITQTRVKDWWAKDRKYYKHRFNPDKIVHTVVRDESKAFELFLAGELDTFLLTRPELWYEKSEIAPVYKGYIERVTFYNRYPKVPRGLYLNVSKPPLDDLNVRIGIHHAMNWQKVIDVMFRGDYQRLNSFNDGYVTFSDPSIKARPFSINLAREAFRAAGFVNEGRDGILTRPDGTRLSISVTYPAIPMTDRMFAILREEAKATGLELRLDGLEFTVAYKKEMQKQHEMALGSWLITPPVPDYHQYLHSTNAFDEKGNLKPQTNNLFSWGRPDTDTLSEKVRTASTEEELRVAAWTLQRIMHDEAIFVPAYSVDFVRIGSWRWVRWPDSETTRFSPAVVFDPHDVFVQWIDTTIQQETQAARRSGKTFPEVTRTVDVHRQVPDTSAAPATHDEPAPPVPPAPADSESVPAAQPPPAGDDTETP
jgi:microcin C transport system substrate-binding protein